MTPAQVLYRWHRQVTGGPRRRNVDAPRIAFDRHYMRRTDAGRITGSDQADADQLYRSWHGPDGGDIWVHSKPLGRTS